MLRSLARSIGRAAKLSECEKLHEAGEQELLIVSDFICEFGAKEAGGGGGGSWRVENESLLIDNL